MDLRQMYKEIVARYPDYITQQQMCEICKISKKTAYNLEQSGRIPYQVEINHLIHAHKIKLDDVLAYLFEKECRQTADSLYIQVSYKYYEQKLATFPDLLDIGDIKEITGFSRSGIQNWIMCKALKALRVKKKLLIPKVYLLNFLISPYYRKIKNKTKEQREDISRIEVLCSNENI